MDNESIISKAYLEILKIKFLDSIKEYQKKEKRTSLIVIIFIIINIIFYISLEALDNIYSYRNFFEINIGIMLTILEVNSRFQFIQFKIFKHKMLKKIN